MEVGRGQGGGGGRVEAGQGALSLQLYGLYFILCFEAHPPCSGVSGVSKVMAFAI